MLNKYKNRKENMKISEKCNWLFFVHKSTKNDKVSKYSQTFLHDFHEVNT